MAAVVAMAVPAFGATVTTTTITLQAGAIPVGIAHGPGGTWFTDPGTGSVGVIDANDRVTVFGLNELDAQPGTIAAGPDGAMWFTEPAINSIGRITTTGEVTDFPVTTGSNPSGMAAGPDGNIWYTLRATNRIGWGTAAGFTELALASGSGPSSITAGPDGGMWFTAQGSARIGRVDVATKQVTTFPLATGSQPSSITAGADGALWFTLRAASQIGRITTAGVVSLTDLPTAGGNPTGISAGSDGSVWFAQPALDRVGRLAEGSLDEFAVGVSPRAVAVDAANDGWVTEATPGTITRIHVDTTPTDTTAPTIRIDSPAPGDWTVLGTGGLAADYTCADETALASCVGDVADGAPVADGTLGARTFGVQATDAAGNTTSASTSYLVFTSVAGTTLEPSARPGAWLTLSLGMDLPRRAADPLAGSTTQVADCATGAALGPHEPALVRSRVGPHGTLELRWDTDRAWTGCRTLWLSFSAAGWTGPEAAFGPVSFGASARRAR
jgi:virginiamycin B lyase